MTAQAGDLATLGARVDWADAGAAAQARATLTARSGTAHGREHGRLGELAGWLAGTQGRCPPRPPGHVRAVVVGTALADATAALAASLDAHLHLLAPSGLAAGTAAADAAADSGVDLLVVAVPGSTVAAAAAVASITEAEPVALLPRGAQATDTADWIARAEALRTLRPGLERLRGRPDDLLTALDDDLLATTVGLVLAAVVRHTPIVLDGATALAAALVVHAVQPRAARWWQVADRSPDPVHSRVVSELGRPPVLDLATSAGDGLAGLLAVPFLRAAADLLAGDENPTDGENPTTGDVASADVAGHTAREIA